MNNTVVNFIHARRIDSFQKLRLLLFMQQHPLSATLQEFAEQLYLKDLTLLENIVSDLQEVGLLDVIKGRYILSDEPTLNSDLQCLSSAFENPLTRQKLIELVRYEWRSRPCKIQT